MTKKELLTEVVRTTDLSYLDVEMVFDAAIAEIKSALARHDSVFLRGFGVFTTMVRKEKKARDIKRGTAVTVPEHNVAVFKPYPELKAKVK